MKRYISILVLLILTVSLVACGGGGPAPSAPATPAPATPATPAPAAPAPAAPTPAPAAPATPAKPAYNGPVMTVKVVTMTPMSGGSARTGVTQEASVSAAEKHMAEDKFLNPAYKIDFVRPFVDDENSTDKAPLAANLAISMNPHIVIGHHLTTMCISSGPLFEEAQIPLIGIISGYAAVEQGFKWFHMGTVTERDSGVTMAEYLYKVKGFRKFLVLARNNESGMPSAESVMDSLEELGAVIDRGKQYMLHDMADSDFTPQALRAKELGIDCLVAYAMSADQAVVLFDQMAQLYKPGVFFAGGTAWGQPSMVELFDPKNLQGIVFPSGYVMDPTDPFKERFRNQFKENDPEHLWPGDNQARVYDACWNIAAAINDMVEAEGYLHPDNDPKFREKLNYYFSQLDRRGVQGHIEYKYFNDGRMMREANIGEWQSDGTAIKVWPK